MHYIDKIISDLNAYMEREKVSKITLPQAHKYLLDNGLLPNYYSSLKEFRNFCSSGFIRTVRQISGKNSRWMVFHSKDTSFSLNSKLDRILKSGKGEREICGILSKYPEVLRWTFCRTGGHGNWILKEFPLGSKYKTDFVIITCYSGKWDIYMVELEPHDDQVITKAGLPSNRLNGAIAQVNDWKEYINQNPTLFRQDLSDWCIKRDILNDSRAIKTPVNGTGQYLKSPDTYLDIHYCIVIGNRVNIDDEKRRKINQIQYSNRIDIFTYGRFCEVAKNFDDYHYGKEGVIFTKTNEI